MNNLTLTIIEREARLLNLLSIPIDKASESEIELVRYALASHNYYSEAYNYCKAVLNAHT